MIYPDLNDFANPAIVAAAVVGPSLVIKSLTKISMGIESNFLAAVKAFSLITAAGVAVKWYQKNKSNIF